MNYLGKFIYPYRMGSGSVLALKAGLEAKTIRLEGSKFKGGSDKFVINWGNSTMKEEFKDCIVLNHPNAVALATDKAKFFEAVNGAVSIPDYTTDSKVARQWLEEGETVVGRQTLTDNSGKGIEILESIAKFEKLEHSFKLYTKYIPKKDEFRIHVMIGKGVIDEQRKAKKANVNYPNWKIRSHANGFVFKREGIEVPDTVREEAIKAVETLGLHFGAVDVVYNNYREKAYVLEVNTAPGLEGQTVDTYIKELDDIYGKVKNKIGLEDLINIQSNLIKGGIYEWIAIEDSHDVS